MALIEPGKVFVGVSGKPEYIHLPFANRHGLITGATGTGKTVSLQILAEGFSAAGVPVFCADVKGDVAGLVDGGRAQGLPRRSAPRPSASPPSIASNRFRSCSGTCSAKRATRSAPR